MADNTLLIGIDLGTSALKCAVWDVCGQCHGAATVPYPTRGGHSAEQDADDWWNALVDGVRRALEGLARERVRAIAVGGHAPSPVAVDAHLTPVAPVSTWLDSRAEPDRERLRRALGDDLGAGGRLGLSLAAKAVWLRRTAPERFARARCLLHSGDFLVARLTGQRISTAPRPWRAFAAADLPEALLPATERATGDDVGHLAADAADRLQLSADVRVVTGGLDSYLAVVGSGIGAPGDVCIIGGSSAIVSLVVPTTSSAATRARFQLGPYPLLSDATKTSGLALDWARRVLGGAPMDELLAAAAEVPAGADGLVFLPYLAGERAPTRRPSARAALFGATLDHGADAIFRAVVEGVVFSQRHVLDAWSVAGAGVIRPDSQSTIRPDSQSIIPSAIRSVGGQARHPFITQLQADVFNLPVHVPEQTESGTLGAAILAAIALGLCPDLEHAAGQMVRMARTHCPRADTRAALDVAYQRYRELAETVGDQETNKEPDEEPS